MARTAAPSSDVPLLKLLYKRLRLLRKKLTRITQTEERLAQGKVLNSDQEGILRSKPVVTALVEELENLRSAALPGDLLSSTPVASTDAPKKPSQDDVVAALSTDVPVFKLLYKRLGLLRKKRTRVIQMEERVAQGKALHREQDEILQSKPVVTALIEELENLNSAALFEELSSSTTVASTEAQEKPLQASPSADVPILKLLSKRLGLLRKKRTRIIKIEERVAQGKTLNNDHLEILKFKPVVTALIEELESLRSAARPEDLSFSTEDPSQDVVVADAAEESSDETDQNTSEEKKELEAVGQQQNLKDTGQKEEPQRNLRNTKHTNSWIDGRRGRRGGRGGNHFGRGQYHDNRYYQNDGGQYYDPGYYQREGYQNSQGYPRYIRNGGGQYNDSGYYSRNSYNTSGRGAGRGGGYANNLDNDDAAQSPPNKDVPAQRAPNNHVVEQRVTNRGYNNGLAERRRSEPRT